MNSPVDNVWRGGLVIRGGGKGRVLGFPTANLQLEGDRPPDGVYACWARLRNQCYRAVLHVGPRPTFPGAESTAEVHLFEFPYQDLYGQTVSFICVQKIRDIAKFDSSAELSLAIAQDCEKAKEILENAELD